MTPRQQFSVVQIHRAAVHEVFSGILPIGIHERHETDISRLAQRRTLMQQLAVTCVWRSSFRTGIIDGRSLGTQQWLIEKLFMPLQDRQMRRCF